MEFIKEDGSLGVVTPDGSHCLIGSQQFTSAVPNVTDPYTGEVGYACKLSQNGLNDLAIGDYGVMYQYMLSKKYGKIACCAPLPIKERY